MSYKLGKRLSADFVCPFCNGRIKYPGSKELLVEYAAEGLLDVRAEATEVATCYVDTAQSFAKAVALWIPATVATVCYVMYADAPLWIVAAEMSIGSAIVFLYAHRTRVIVEPVEESEAPPEPMRIVATVNKSKFGESLVWYSAPKYEASGRPVPDYKVWMIFDAYMNRGIPFSITKLSEVKGIGRPAAEAVCHDFGRLTLAEQKGQDFIVSPPGRSVMRAWLRHDRPPMTFERGEAVMERTK